MKKILILSSNPRKDLNLDREIRDLRKVIEQSNQREQYGVVDELAVRVEDLQGLFLKHEPQIVHFCGHGNGEQGLVFDDENGGEQVDSQALSELLKLICEIQPIQCVLLNACYSEIQADVFVRHIDYVIGMKQEIQDKAAHAFSIGFYRALGYGRPITDCYNFGCNAIQLVMGSSNVLQQGRKLTPVDDLDQIKIPEHLKPILKIKQTLLSTQPPSNINVAIPNSEIQTEIRNALEQEQIIVIKEIVDGCIVENPEPRGNSSLAEGIPDFLNRLLEDYFNQSSLKWTLCFTGEDQSSKLGELTRDLRSGFSSTGDGKRIPSGFSYWGIVSTLAWENTCSDSLYPVMKESISSFQNRWNKFSDREVIDQKYHYVSLGVGTGDKDNHILRRLYKHNNCIRYFPIDMSSMMLRIGVQKATNDIPLKGSHVLPIQIDFSFQNNINELRNLLDQIDNDFPILFSLLGNTLANFPEDTELLQILSRLMRNGDKLLLEVATTEELSQQAAEQATREYANASSFKRFVTSALLQYTDLHIDFDCVQFEGSIEPNGNAIFIKVFYRNSTGKTISVMLPDREHVDFQEGDTIRLLTTRKYTSKGINRILSDCKFRTNSRTSSRLIGRNKHGFGIDLILLSMETDQ